MEPLEPSGLGGYLRCLRYEAPIVPVSILIQIGLQVISMRVNASKPGFKTHDHPVNSVKFFSFIPRKNLGKVLIITF